METKALPPAARRAIPAFYWGGWISFWTQLVLAVVAGLMFVLAIPAAMSRDGTKAGEATPGTGFGIVLAGIGLLVLILSIFWAFRYTRFSRLLKEGSGRELPKRSSAIQMLKRGLYINIFGAIATLLGAEAIAGLLFSRALQTQGMLPLTVGQTNNLVNALDIFIVLANTHTIFAHFVGILMSLFLLNLITQE